MKDHERLEKLLGSPAASATPLHGGCVAEVLLLRLADGRKVVAKRRGAAGGPSLETEGWMLRLLAERGGLPVPHILHAEEDLLLLGYVEGDDGLADDAQADAAERIAALHAVTGPAFGLERATPIGALTQENDWTDSWLDFFAQRRLMPVARLAHERGRLPRETLAAVERCAGRLSEWLEEPPAPALLHGDLWSGNVISRGGRVAAFLDPAVYYGHPEVELAFGTLFGTLGRDFFARYCELRPIAPGFFELRRDLYNIYPLLVHAAMFGATYPGAVARILARIL